PPLVLQLHSCGDRASVATRLGRQDRHVKNEGASPMKLCGFDVGLNHPFFLIAGPCVIESRQMAFDTAGALKEITSRLGIPFIYKSSFDKANRSSDRSYRG